MQRPRRKLLLLFLFLAIIGSFCVSRGQQQEKTKTTATAAATTASGQQSVTKTTKKSSFYLVQQGQKDHRRVAAAAAAAAAVEEENDVIIPYIIDGMPVVPEGRFSFFVNSYNGNSLCGGSLIHQDVILTSAHCHGAFNKGLLLGGGDVKQPMAEINADKYLRINLQRPHPSFSERPDMINDDIMVLRLEKPITSVTPVTLNTDPAIPADYQSCIAIGHGRTEKLLDINDAPPSKELLQAELEVLPQEECADKLSSFDNVIVKEDILCATNANKQSNSSICQGDSGGPLLLVVNDEQLFLQVVQVGITSFTEECSADPVPNGFTRVSTFYDWIQEQICDISVVPPASCPKRNSTSLVGEEGIPVEIVFRHDANPEETTWSIRDRQDKKILFAGPEYVAQPGDVWSTILYLPPGQYLMDVFDSAGDGLGWPASIVIQTAETEEYPNSRILMDESPGGTFVGVRIQLPFVVVDPNAPTSAPSSAPSMVTLPTISPIPSMTPTPAPTERPTVTPSPTDRPTVFPTVALTLSPSNLPSASPPTDAPSFAPSFLPSAAPSQGPSISAAPTTITTTPTRSPYPTGVPTEELTPFPTNPPSRAVEPAAELPDEQTSSTQLHGPLLSLSTFWMVIIPSLWFFL